MTTERKCLPEKGCVDITLDDNQKRILSRGSLAIPIHFKKWIEPEPGNGFTADFFLTDVLFEKKLRNGRQSFKSKEHTQQILQTLDHDRSLGVPPKAIWEKLMIIAGYIKEENGNKIDIFLFHFDGMVLHKTSLCCFKNCGEKKEALPVMAYA